MNYFVSISFKLTELFNSPEESDEKYQCSGYYQYDWRRLNFPLQEMTVLVEINQYQYSGNQYSQSRNLFAMKNDTNIRFTFSAQSSFVCFEACACIGRTDIQRTFFSYENESESPQQK